ncbi:rod shape-determining protein MreD [Streptomyces calidiresistens]|uniref:Rod shape-determining protein MreD n=1 Tax=Streptomyces calidiresistens TaxID=1485586 RepID=A0A7W3XW35_9ACTN|nr:rod shape-determining protein MreD [Streptomyces calidiresistens]MBB0229327.1 rod shape-determining protein MreD [Streptomyces calidiresistens]
MRLNRTLLAIVLLVPALVLQVSILARLQLPGAVPDLLLLTVLGLALVYGHVGGALVGFAAGLLADLSPPADHAVGRYALVLCVIGYLAGLTRPETGRHRSATVPMAVVAGAAVASTLLYAGVGTLVGDTAADTSGLIALALTATLYDLLLAPFVVPGVMALARRFENDPLAGDQQAPTATDSAASWSGASRRRGLRRPRTGRLLGKPLGGTGLTGSPLTGRRPRRGAGAAGLGGVKVKGVKRL